jgi:hypothetical protein
MSEVLIKRIMALSGPMPDLEAHRNYLRTLPAPSLSARLSALEQESNRHEKKRTVESTSGLNSTDSAATEIGG